MTKTVEIASKANALASILRALIKNQASYDQIKLIFVDWEKAYYEYQMLRFNKVAVKVNLAKFLRGSPVPSITPKE